MFNSNFAKVYNLIHINKNYYNESLKIKNLLQSYKNISHSNLLDYGCGQCNHLFYLDKNFKNVYGYDPSNDMIEIAQEKYNHIFSSSDINTFLDNPKKYDFIISMFDVFSYFTSNKILKKNILQINKLLKNKGLFLFEFWFEESVMHYKPISYVKNINQLKKECITKINYKKKTITIDYKINFENKYFYEKHKVRYFSKKEIEYYLNIYNFKILRFGYMNDLRKNLKPSQKYSVFCLAKKLNNV